MDHAALDVDGIGVAGGPAGFEAAALVDGNVHQHRARPHGPDHFAGDQLGGRGSRNQYRADDEVGALHFPGDDFGRGVERADTVAEPGRQFLQPCEVDVEDGDVGLQADGHFQGIRTGHTGAHDDNPRRSHSWHTAKQQTASGRHLQVVSADLGRHAPGNAAHGLEQRQRSVCVGDGLVGYGGGAGPHQRARLLRVRRQVQVGEQNLPGREPGAFFQLRFLDLDDHFRCAENLVGVTGDLGAGSGVFRVVEPGACACAGLDQHAVTFPGEPGRGIRRQADPVFVILDFFRNADAHLSSPLR